MMKRKRLSRTCFKPFKDTNSCKNKRVNDLRQFPTKDLWKFPTADETYTLCSVCRKLVSNYEPPIVEDVSNTLSQISVESLTLSQQISSQSSSVGTTSNFSGSLKDYDDHSLETFLNISPVEKFRVDRVAYQTKKFEEIHAAFGARFVSQFGVLPKTTTDQLAVDNNSMLNNLKKIYNAGKDKSIRLKLLSVLPSSWDYLKVQSEFHCSRLTVLNARQLIEGSSNDAAGDQNSSRKPGHQALDSEIIKLVTNFYEDDTNSRQLAGIRDVKSVKKSDGTRENIQKRLILSNLHELYTCFKTEHPEAAIKFSKFASLRPQHCVIAGTSGTHTVCVRTLHQNVKLMLEGCKFSLMIEDNEWIEKSVPIYQNLLKKLLCKNPTELCHSRSCTECPGSYDLVKFFEKLFDDYNIDEIEYKQWTPTDRCTIINVVTAVDEFIESLVKQLQMLVKHDYTSKAQSHYYADLKSKLQEGEFIVTLDFAENYAFVVQESVQSVHYNNDQATILPMSIYYNNEGNIHHCSFVGITDCLKHDFFMVHLFQSKLVAYLKKKIPFSQKDFLL